MNRLSNATVTGLTDLAGLDVAHYDRSAPPSIVHLGMGGFARAHLAVYADDLLRRGRDAAVEGVSLRSSAAERALGPQDGWFTVTTREPSIAPTTRVVGSVVAAATGADAAITAIARPATALVTLTVTEKAYEHAGPGSVATVVAAALERRRERTGRGVVVASLDNVADNGRVLADQVLRAAGAIDDDLPRWIHAHVAFPRSVVDRMVPAATEADRSELAGRLGVRDDAAVFAEAHRSWVIEANDRLPPLGAAGVEVTDDIDAHQRRKLWLLNGPHSAVAYGGLLAGHRTISAAVADDRVGGFAHRLVDDTLEVVPDGSAPGGADPDRYARTSLRRFANPALGHTCVQVAADGSRKLPQRLLPVVVARRALGLPTTRFALVVAAWVIAVTRTPAAGRTLALVDDPAAARVTAALSDQGAAAAVEAGLGPVDPIFATEVADAVAAVRNAGIGAWSTEA